MAGIGTRIQDGKVIRRECDRAMADKKGYTPCNKDCKNCLACIETNADGMRCHTQRKK